MKTTKTIPQILIILAGFAVATSYCSVSVDAHQHGCENSQHLESVSEISSPVRYAPQHFDVLNYDVDLDARRAPSLTLGPSRCDIRFVWTSDPDTFRFHLRSLHVDSVYYVEHHGGSSSIVPCTAQTYGVESDSTFHYEIAASASQAVGDTVDCVVFYSGTMTAEPIKGGLSWGGVARDQSDAMYALGVGFHCNYVSCTQHWMPCYDLPSDKATLSLRVTCPASLVALSNGLMKSDSIRDSLHIVHWQMTTPCATYLYTFEVGPYLQTEYDTASNGASEVLYAKKGDTLTSHITFRHLSDMVKTFEKLYGPYPNEKVGYVVTNNGSMEHQSLICLARAEILQRDSVNEHVAHELSHQWFGDLVTPYDFRDAWLTESFATYSESAWRESFFGYPAYVADQKSKASLFMADVGRPGGRYFEGILSIYDFDRALPSSNYPQTIYLKGAVVLGMLRYMIGDTSFYGALREYLSRYAYGNATYDSLVNCIRNHVPDKLKDSVSAYFREWVKGKGWPTLDIQCEKYFSAGRWRVVLHCRQVQNDSFGIYTWFPLELSFQDGSGGTINRVVVINGATQDLTLDSLNDCTRILTNAGDHVITLATLTATPTITELRASDPDINETVLYPNPATNVIRIRSFESGAVRYALYAMDGELCVKSGVLDGLGVERQVDVSSVADGSYMLRLTSSRGTELLPCIIAR